MNHNEQVLQRKMYKETQLTWIKLRNSLIPNDNLELVIMLYNLKTHVESMRYFVNYHRPIKLEDIVPVNNLIMDIKDKDVYLNITTISPSTYKNVDNLSTFINKTSELIDLRLTSIMGVVGYTIFKEISEKIKVIEIHSNQIKLNMNSVYGS